MFTIRRAQWPAAAALGAIALWTIFAAYEAFDVFPWDVGPVYFRVAGVVSSSAEAVLIAVLALWLIGRAETLRSP